MSDQFDFVLRFLVIITSTLLALYFARIQWRAVEFAFHAQRAQPSAVTNAIAEARTLLEDARSELQNPRVATLLDLNENATYMQPSEGATLDGFAPGVFYLTAPKGAAPDTSGATAGIRKAKGDLDDAAPALDKATTEAEAAVTPSDLQSLLGALAKTAPFAVISLLFGFIAGAAAGAIDFNILLGTGAGG